METAKMTYWLEEKRAARLVATHKYTYTGNSRLREVPYRYFEWGRLILEREVKPL